MKYFPSLIVATFLMAAPVIAQEQPVVVELYTSQGCSSCPPADEFLHELAAQDNVIALAMHVDYWDYIGWKDVFAKPEHTKRQQAYAQFGGRRMIYTPQMIINGTDHVVGNRPMDVTDLINRHAKTLSDVEMAVSREGDVLRISVQPNANVDGPLRIQLLRYKSKNEVAIERGENAGRTISYANVVTDLQIIGEWNPGEALETTVPVTGDQPVVVMMQKGGYGPVEAVALLE